MQWKRPAPSRECLNVLFRSQALPFMSRAAEEKFALTEQHRYLLVDSPDTFLAFVGMASTDEVLATMATRSGWTALHLIAVALGQAEVGSTREAQWLDFGCQLLKDGADPVALHKENSDHGCSQGWKQLTPLLTYLAHCLSNGTSCTTRFLKHLHIWADMLHTAGVDLMAYGVDEHQIWFEADNDLDHITNIETGMLMPARLSYAPTAENWSMSVRKCTSFRVYCLCRTPGEYPVKEVRPTQILWSPRDAEIEEGAWLESGTHILRSVPQDVKTLPEVTPEAITELFDNSQDDSGIVAILAFRAAKQTPRSRREHSCPPSVSRIERPYGIINRGRRWMPSYYLSPLDAKYRFTHSDIGCLAQCYHPDSDIPVLVQDSLRWGASSFLAEIRACQHKLQWKSPISLSGAVSIRHTGKSNCPQGCSRVRLDELAVPRALRKHHPVRKFKRSCKWSTCIPMFCDVHGY